MNIEDVEANYELLKEKRRLERFLESAKAADRLGIEVPDVDGKLSIYWPSIFFNKGDPLFDYLISEAISAAVKRLNEVVMRLGEAGVAAAA